MPLPPDLLAAISHPGGGRVVLVVGAGGSFEPPTSIPLARQCAEEAHRRLILDAVLAPGDCPNPADLSAVADAVREKTHSQAALVERMPRGKFRNAPPNDGHLLVAAMLYERAISCVLTLNFDLAFSHAIAWLGVADEISVITGPADHVDLGITNLVYLHRNVDADSEHWILRSVTLVEEWRASWQEALATRVLVASIVVFAGLGTAAAVLIETVQRIRGMLDGYADRIYQVDPLAREASAFFGALRISPERYLRMGWIDFVRQLSERFLEEQLARLLDSCNVLCASEGWVVEDVTAISDRIRTAGLLGFGQLRARWLLEERQYVPESHIGVDLIADLVLSIAMIERAGAVVATFTLDGVVDFRRGAQLISTVLPVSGRGVRRWTTLEGAVRSKEYQWRTRHSPPRYIVVAGVPGGRQPISSPASIVREDEPVSIVGADIGLEFVDVDALRTNPDRVREILR